jgi:hypothetical protein
MDQSSSSQADRARGLPTMYHMKAFVQYPEARFVVLSEENKQNTVKHRSETLDFVLVLLVRDELMAGTDCLQ